MGRCWKEAVMLATDQGPRDAIARRRAQNRHARWFTTTTLIAPGRRPSSALPRSACVGDHHCHGAVVVLEVALSFPSCDVVLKKTLAAVTPIASAAVLDK
jgi:hypothetical protein